MTSDNKTTATAECTKGMSLVVRNQADAMKHIDLAIAADESYCLPHLVKAWMLHGAHDDRFCEQMAAHSNKARELLPAGNTMEYRLLAALESMCDGNRLHGINQLAALCAQYPDNAYLQVVAQEETFWLGDAELMRHIVERASPHWSDTHPDYGPYLSLRAFANEEAGYYDAAERYGREAVEIDPADVWGAHAVAHVLLMKGEVNNGIEWLDNLSPNWALANQMQHHLWWHYCLFLFETHDHDRILELLHSKIRNPQSPLIKAAPTATIDNNNYASLLMRLELYGVDVAPLWQTLAGICANRTSNHASVFSNIHDMMVLAASEQYQQAQELLSNLCARFSDPGLTGSIAEAYRQVGIPVCKAILAHRKKDYLQVIELLGGVRHQLHLMGASPAQRDVFYHLLVDAARREHCNDLEQQYINDISRLGFCDVPARAAYTKAHRH